ncbi:formylglycine-generating enzyme family protein [Silvimonas soli]|uniref:formylglycine-generating enzyme family protein n=1 Tax=Silvimonas soli TaxID=2980100 RepID=UPI0024B33DD3|nr:formylglycine-generating enzyme family protein [Silvimonas soli]
MPAAIVLRRRWLAITVLLAVAAGGTAWRVQAHTTPTPVLANLGSPAQCARYSGLPSGWGEGKEAGMVHLASGDFTFGTKLGYPDERPQGDGRTHVDAFWIDQTEVTNAQFASFVKKTAYITDSERQGGAVVFHVPTDQELHARPYAWWTWVKGADWRHPSGPGSNVQGLDNHPVTLVTQADALAYAHWLGHELPTEAEWEYAGKAGHDGVKLETAPKYANGKPSANYWQGVFPQVDTASDGHAGLAPVGCYQPSDFKLYDMIGNAWEWTRDVYSGEHQFHSNGDTAAVANQAITRKSDTPMVIKGGSFLCSPDYCVRYRASSREEQEADLPASHIGFRTIKRG